MIETQCLPQTALRFQVEIVIVARIWFQFWAILLLSGLFSGQPVRAQDLSSQSLGRYAPVDQTEQTMSENELYAEAKRFLDAKDYTRALPLMEKVADAGHLLAMNDLGDMYFTGEGVPQEYEQAFAWYRKGAKAGNVLAMANLAYLYEHGRGVAKDSVQACVWYRKAAAAGDKDAIRNLRILDPNGEAVAPDENQIREWDQNRAIAGDATAMYKLGGMYEAGRGMPQDYAKAAEWYQKAAQSGLGEAMNDLGCLYAKGQGVAEDESKAREWYQKAAEAGCAAGSQNLKQLKSIDNSFQNADRLARGLFWVFLLPAATVFFAATGRYTGRLPSQFRGPSRVKLALLLLWINLTLALTRIAFASFLDQGLGVGIGCFIGVVGLAFHAVLLSFVAKGSNTARVILLVTILLIIPLSPVLAQIAVKSLLSATSMVASLALSGFALFLLFSGGSGHWFSRGRTGIVSDGQPEPG